jgi:hypothetical protein
MSSGYSLRITAQNLCVTSRLLDAIYLNEAPCAKILLAPDER